jgi:hypothetical protein
MTAALSGGVSRASLAPAVGVTQTKRGFMTNATSLTKTDLLQFTGTENWHRHAINRKVLYTDGVKYLADHAGAYWLIDQIALRQPYNKSLTAEAFQVWKLAVRPDHYGTLTCEDGNGRSIFTKKLFTDFPLDEITLYFTDNVIMLTSEY